MPIPFYQIIKDLFGWWRIKEIAPLDPRSRPSGLPELHELAAMGIIDTDTITGNKYRWIKPNQIFAQTEARDSKYQVVWHFDRRHRTKQKIGCYTQDGTLDLILVREKEG